MIISGNRGGGGDPYEIDIGEQGELDRPPMGVESTMFELRIVEFDGRHAVLKMPRGDLDEGMAQIAKLRLLREARLMDTPGLWPDPIPFLGSGIDPVPHVLTSFHEDRIALSLSRSRFDGRQLRGFAEALFSHLATLHAKGVLHRDIKPGNLLVRQEEDRLTNDLWFIDLSNGADGSLPQEPERATSVGTTVGTTGWMCPHCLLDRSRDKRCDVFAAALVVYSLGADDPDPLGDAISPSIVRDRLAALDLGLVPDGLVRDVISEALQPEPDGRPQARKVAASLRVGSEGYEAPDRDEEVGPAATGERRDHRRPATAATAPMGVPTTAYSFDPPTTADPVDPPTVDGDASGSASWRPPDAPPGADRRDEPLAEDRPADPGPGATASGGGAAAGANGQAGHRAPGTEPGGEGARGQANVPYLPSVEDFEGSCRNVQDKLEHKYATVGWTDDGPPRRGISTGTLLRIAAVAGGVLLLLLVLAVVTSLGSR